MEPTNLISKSYTPGPWKVQFNGFGEAAVSDCSNKNFSRIICKLDGQGKEEEAVIANAELLAVAPEMAEAMLEFCQRVEVGEVRSTHTYTKFKEILRKAGLLKT